MSSKLFLSSGITCLLLTFLIITSVGASSAMWSRTYGGTDEDAAFSLVETSDGGYALAGYTKSFDTHAFWLVKTDANGNAEWKQTYGGTHTDRAYSLVETSDGGYALVGGSLLVKTDAKGSMLWNRTIGGQFRSLIETSDGGYAMAGNIWGIKDAILMDFWLVKTDANGNEKWHRTYGGANLDSASSLVETSDGGYAIAGATTEIGSGDGDCWLIKTDSDGNIQWNQTYGGTSDDVAESLIGTSDGGYALAGSTSSFGAGEDDFWLIKTDVNGNMEWNQTYGGAEPDRASSLVETSDGGYALAGYTTSFDTNAFWLVKTDANGNAEWNQTYGGTHNDRAFSLVETSDGGYALAGYTTSLGAGESDFWLVKTDEHGIIPEFPSWTLLLIMLVAVMVVAIIYRRNIRKHDYGME